VVSCNNIGVRRRNTLIIRAALAVIRDTLLLRRRARRAGSLLGGAVVHVAGVAMVRLWLRLRLLVLRVAVLMRAWWALDVDVCDAVALTVLGQRLVLVGWLGVLGDEIPCVDEARDVAKTAEEDVNEGVCAAETALDPY
jgi:hypothetical protein